MEPQIILKLFISVILLVMASFFASSEAALFSLKPHQLEILKDRNLPRFKVISHLLDYPRKLLISIAVGNEFVNIAISAIGTSLSLYFFGERGEWLAIFFLLPLLIIFGDILPKSIAYHNPIWLSQRISRPLKIFVTVIAPIRWLIKKMVDFSLKIFGQGIESLKYPMLEDDFRELVDIGHKEGTVEREEKELIYRVLDFANTIVSEIMTAREKIFALPIDLDMQTLIQKLKENHYSRIPLYAGELDSVKGILFAKDTLGFKEKKRPKEGIKNIIKPPFFVPETKKVSDLLRDFRRKKIHLALVVDEYGYISGMVTMHDILEELFGKIS